MLMHSVLAKPCEYMHFAAQLTPTTHSVTFVLVGQESSLLRTQYSRVQYSTVGYSTVGYSTVQYIHVVEAEEGASQGECTHQRERENSGAVLF